MEKKTLNKLLMVVTLLLGIAGLALILISIFVEEAPRSVLTAGMIAVAVGTIMNVRRNGKKEK
jgi:carbon starvation protein CstA